LWSRRPSPGLIVALIALAVAIGGVAVAAPGGGGTIQGCFNERGALRVVDTGAACEAGETALTWNQQGPPGPRGSDGAVGPQGPAGDPRLLDGAGPTDEQARSPALSAPVKKPRIKIKIKKKKPKIKIDPNAPPGKLFQYSNVVGDGPQSGDFVYVKPGVAKTVARLELPEGRFLVIAEATVDPTGPENHNAIYSGDLRCELHTTQQGRVARDHITGRGLKSLTMQGAAFHSKTGAVELRCENKSLASSTSLWNTAISAISVSSIKGKWE
jgi:hypothetical protein